MTTYSLGSADPEIARLEQQAEFLDRATRLMLAESGIAPGMRVLDLGAGLGHVSRAVGDLVGTGGEVVGVDSDPRMLEAARRRTAAAHVRFVAGDVLGWTDARPFDAVVGRLILFHLPDPVAAVRHHLAGLRPEGRFVALDFDVGSVRSDPTEPFTTRLADVMLQAFRAVGTDPTIGSRVQGILIEAGVADVDGFGIQPYVAPGSPLGPSMLAGVLHTLAPAIVGHGLASPEELDDRLAARIAAALETAHSVLVPPVLAGAWGRRP